MNAPGDSQAERLANKIRELENSNDELNNLLSSTDIATVLLDVQLQIRHFTLPAKNPLKLSATDIGKSFTAAAAAIDDEHFTDDAQQVLNEHTPRQRKLCDANGTWYLRRIAAYRTHFDRVEGVVITFAEITRLVNTELQLDRMNRLLNTLGEIDRMIVRSTSQEDIFNQVCHILVANGGFRMTWIGMANFDQGTVTPVASAGITGDYLQTANIRCDDSPQAQGPTGRAIRTGLHQINNDTEADALYRPWRERARQMNYRASAAFPIESSGKVLGAINVYAREAAAFGMEETRLLDEMAGTIGFALQNIENIAQRSRAEAALQSANSDLESRVAERTTKLRQEIEERNRQQQLIETAAVREKLIADLLRRGLHKLTLEEYLRYALNLLTENAARLGIAAQSISFLTEHIDEHDNRVLKLVASTDHLLVETTNISPDLPYGTCICGRHKRQECQIFHDDVDVPAETRYRDEISQQRFCAATRNTDGNLGILSFHLSPGYSSGVENFTFLEQVADAMNLAISNFMSKSALIQAKAAADSASKAKSEFLARMSHELRTPLNAILGFSQLLQMDNDEFTGNQADAIGHILDSGRHLLNLIDEVLDIARVDAGTINFSLQNIRLDEVLQSALMLIKPLADERSVNIEQTGDFSYSVKADPLRLKQILINLLSNAVKYSQTGGTVHISCVSDNSPATPDSPVITRVTVTDTGPGISEQDQKRIFEPFQQISIPGIKTDSIGFGLAITQKLVTLMGGTIGMSSTLGKGSSFWFELPMASETLTAEGKSPSTIAGTHSRQRGENRTILYIEDNPANLKLMQHIIRRFEDYTLLSATTAEAGIEIATNQRPDLILMDIDLPGMDGFSALQILRAQANTKQIPVIAVSAMAMPAQVDKGLQAGFEGYLSKPLNIDKFMATLDQFEPGIKHSSVPSEEPR